jgi:hypothetical protein
MAAPHIPEENPWFNVVFPNFRNGDIGSIPSAAPRASLPEPFYWAVIEGMTHANCKRYIWEFCRATYGQLTLRNDANTPAATLVAQRQAAIIIGCIRCAAFGTYLLGPDDMTLPECVFSARRYQAAVTAAQVAAAHATIDANAEIADKAAAKARIVVKAEGMVAREGNATATAREAREAGFTAFVEAERDLVIGCSWIGVAIPVLQGASLVNSGHHYLPTTANYYEGLVRQSSVLHAPQFERIVEEMGDAFRDAAFHKACHPIGPERKRRWASDPTVKARLEEAQHTAAAIRLPALPAEVAGLKAGVAVIRKARPTIVRFGGTVSIKNGEAILKKLEQATGEPLTPAQLKDAIIEARNWVLGNQGSIVFCAGIVSALQNTAATFGQGQMKPETTLKAFSIKKLIADNPADYNQGLLVAQSAQQRDRTQLEREGTLQYAMDA